MVEAAKDPPSEGSSLGEEKALRAAVREACEVFESEYDHLKRELGPDLNDELVDSALPEFTRIADALFERLAKLEKSHLVPPAGLTRVRAAFRRHTAIQHFYDTPFNKKALRKRFNYAGDFEIIDLLLTLKLDSSGLQRLFDAYLHAQPAVKAVLGRHELISRMILEEAERNRESDQYRIASIGCGSGREYLPLLEQGHLRDAEIQLVDTCPEALEFAGGLLSPKASSTSFRYHNEDVFAYFKKRLENLAEGFGGKVHFLYCFGVMDYLREPVVRRMLRTFLETVVPGGLCVVGNFSPKNPSRAYMDWLLEWPLKYREKDDFVQMAKETCGDLASIEVVEIEEGVTNCLVLRPSETRKKATPDPTRWKESTVEGPSGRPTMEQHRQSVVRGLGLSCLLGALLYPMWILLDAAVVKELLVSESAQTAVVDDPRLKECFWIRIVVMTYLALVALSCATAPSRPQRLVSMIWAGAAGHLLMGFGLVWIMHILDAFGSNYHAGLIMVLIAISTLTPWRPIRTAFELLLIATAYVVAAILHDIRANDDLGQAVVQNIAFVAGAAFLLSLSTFLVPIYRMPRLSESAVAKGRARAERKGRKGFMIRLSGLKFGLKELRQSNPTVIRIAALVVGLLVILGTLIWIAFKAMGADGVTPEMKTLIIQSFMGVISAVLVALVGAVFNALLRGKKESTST